jgi:hypothetical protein
MKQKRHFIEKTNKIDKLLANMTKLREGKTKVMKLETK